MIWFEFKWLFVTNLFIHICDYTHIYLYTCIYTHIYLYTYAPKNMYIYTHARIHMYTYTHTIIHMYTYTHTSMHMYTYRLINEGTGEGVQATSYDIMFYIMHFIHAIHCTSHDFLEAATYHSPSILLSSHNISYNYTNF